MEEFLQRLKLEVTETKNARLRLQADSRMLKNQLQTIRASVKTSMMVKPKTVHETFTEKEKLSKTI